MTKKVLITGAAGFIGFHLAKHLQTKQTEILGLDNFNDYYTPALKRARAENLKAKGVSVVEGDICHPSLLKELIDRHEITHLVHLAAQAGVRYSLVNPQAYVKSNIEGFLNVLETCRHFPHLKLTYASSSSVYGTNDKVPFSIDDQTDHQASFYGVTKKTNELMAFTYHHLYGIPSVGLRFFTVYGPWGRPDMAYFSFAKAISENKPIEIYNHGKMMRDFTYIDDIIQGTIAAMDLNAGAEVYNLGNHQPVELLTFIEILEECLGKKAIKINLPMQPGDVTKTFADISHSKDKLGFLPTTSLKKGIPKFVDWYLREGFKHS